MQLHVADMMGRDLWANPPYQVVGAVLDALVAAWSQDRAHTVTTGGHPSINSNPEGFDPRGHGLNYLPRAMRLIMKEIQNGSLEHNYCTADVRTAVANCHW
jgi:hypothetical protein